mgnify:CR=1 FL=1
MGISNLLIYAMVSTNAQVVSIAEVVPDSPRAPIVRNIWSCQWNRLVWRMSP